MLRVALTGGVGSGKSAVAAMLRDLGASISRSDEVGREMMRAGQPVFRAIRDHFGLSVVLENGELDRSALAQLAFQQGRVEELNAIVHPAVIAAQARWMDGIATEHPGAVAVVESALVFETKHGVSFHSEEASNVTAALWRTRFDRIVVVTASIALRRERYMQRAGTPTAAADFDRRAAAQWSDAEKSALADFLIPNEGSLNELRNLTSALYLRLRHEAADAGNEAM